MAQTMSDIVYVVSATRGRRRSDALVTRNGAGVPTAVRFRTAVAPAVGDVIDARPGSLTVAALASTGQDLTDSVTVAT